MDENSSPTLEIRLFRLHSFAYQLYKHNLQGEILYSQGARLNKYHFKGVILNPLGIEHMFELFGTVPQIRGAFLEYNSQADTDIRKVVDKYFTNRRRANL